jgi:peptidoglycan/LPS O-acetylase OafA/YrhL
MLSETKKKKYFKEIDILRAFSVILIFLYHYDNKLFKLGYLGVDIFFVISGFVITLTLKDLKDFSLNDLKNFYLRRVKRLYPALIFCVALTTIFYLFFGFLFQGNNIKDTIISSLLGYSNFFFHYQSKDYFQQDFLNPFDHIWSLSVEIQFYILYSIFLILIYKFFKKNLLYIFSILTFVSFMYFISLKDNLYFYNTAARFWEFGIGIIVFYLYNINYNKKKIIFSLLFYLIVFFLLYDFIINNQKLKIISCLTLIAFIIFSIRNISIKKFSLFKINFFSYLGKISYSFYLFHFPVLYFLDLYFPHNYVLIVSFLLTFLLSTFSFFYIENYFRYKKSYFLDFKKYNLIFLFLLLVISIYSFNRAKFFTIDNLKKINYLERQDISNLSLNVPENYKIKKNNLNANISFFVLGDSLGQQYLPLLDSTKNIGLLVYFDSNKDCILKKDVNSEGCNNLINKINNSSNKDKYFFISFYPGAGNKNEELLFYNNLNILLDKLNNNTNVIFNLPVILPFKGSACTITFKSCLFSKKFLIDNSFKERKIFTKEYSNNLKIYRFDLLDLMCDKDNCDLNAKNNNKLLIFRDNIHLTYKGSESLSSIFDIYLSKFFD